MAGLRAIVGRQKIGASDAADIELPVRIHFEAIHRGEGTAAGENFVVFTVMTGLVVANSIKSRLLYDIGFAAYEALRRASERPTPVLTLTTGEFKAVCAFFKSYFSLLPSLDLKTLHGAALVAAQQLERSKAA